MLQKHIWQSNTDTGDFTELCYGLYQREVELIAKDNFVNIHSIQLRLQSLPYYISRTAHAMIKVIEQGHSPLLLDNQNATWFTKQSNKIPWLEETKNENSINTINWYLQKGIHVGLVVPVLLEDHVIVDSIVRIDPNKHQVCTNVGGWFSLTPNGLMDKYDVEKTRLLKPSKKIMVAACNGHCWHNKNKQRPITPTLRELLLSCSINWKNFKKSLAI